MPVSFSGPAWGREEVVSLGAPPKLTTGDGYEQMPGTASLIRRNPRASESVLLRKARSFALHKYEAAHGWQPSGNEYSAWGAGGLMEVRCKPPRELAEIGTAWATAALRESKVPPNPMWCPQHCGSRLLTNTVCQALDKGGSVEALDATRVEGAIGLQLSLSLGYDADSAESGEAPPARLLFEAPDYGIKDHPALEREQAWYATELVFLTECRTKAAVNVQRVLWAYSNDHVAPSATAPGLRECWEWANARFPEHPWVLGEYCALLEDLSHCPRYQDLALGEEQVMDLAGAYAKLHASFWEDEDTIGKDCFLKNRPVTDVRNVEDIVDSLIDRGQLPADDDNMLAEMLVAAAHMRTQLLAEVVAHGSTLIRGERTVGSWVATEAGPTALGWGAVTVGHGSYDLALVYTFGLTKDQQHEMMMPMLARYYETLTASGVDAAAYTAQMLEDDFKTMLWEVAFDYLLSAGRTLMELPKLGAGMAYRDRKRVMAAVVGPQQAIGTVVRALTAADAFDVIGMEGSDDDSDD